MSTLDVSGRPSYRLNNAFGFIICALLLATVSLYIEPHTTLANCALCTVVRALLLAMSGAFLLGFLLNFSRLIQLLLSVINMVLLLTGIVTIIRYTLTPITEVPAPSCNQAVLAQLDASPPQDVLLSALNNAIICPGPQWNLYGVSFAQLSLAAFVILFLVVWKLMTKKQKRDLSFR
ncbi:disulfide bond formation protein B [Amphritea sp. HPY]|uniref:disulfide bond formation protein B n=1 Tax=Amphritea sp. HPY TaxID=3421652 RepID=UPI003D7E64D7